MPRTIRQLQQENAVRALRVAILDGATHDYERLVNRALESGVGEDALDLLIHDALEALFVSAEQPVTQRDLASFTARLPEPEFA